MKPSSFKTYLLTLFPFLILDGLWLGFVAPVFYKTQIGHLMIANPNMIAAVLFYLLYVSGLVVFFTGREGTIQQTPCKDGRLL